MKAKNAVRTISRTTAMVHLLAGISAALVMMSLPGVSSAQEEVAQTPLTVSSGRVSANLLFNLDDSGSMVWEITPDELGAASTMFVLPAASSNVVEDTGYRSDNVASAWLGDWYGRAVRSPQVNSSYYNPRVRYRPWVDHEGNEYGNADSSAAQYRPGVTDNTRNLAAFETVTTNWCTDREGALHWQGSTRCGQSNGGSGYTGTEQTFWPAVYYEFDTENADPTDPTAQENLDNYSIKIIAPDGMTPMTLEYDASTDVIPTSVNNNGVDPYTYPKYPDRKDCAGVDTCTYEEEIQNFANWYTYHRSRVLAARGGIGRGFSDLDSALRVGYTAINDDAVRMGVREFNATNKEQFYGYLYDDDIGGSTPLREAMQTVGGYFEDGSSTGPWVENPGAVDPGEVLECRQSFHILMTDGYWNDDVTGVGNVDNTSGSSISNPDGTDFQYQPEPPYKDGYSNTLADVAMEYWVNDLLPTVGNRVPTTTTNPAYWQHLVTFGVGLGVKGNISPDDAFAAMSTGDVINWPDPAASNPAKIDDLLHAAVNSRGGFFTAQDPDTFAAELSNTLASIVDRTESSAASVATNSTRLDADTMVYQARFNTVDWSGELFAFPLDPTTGELEDRAWDAGELIQYSGRQVATWNPNLEQGVAFTWNNLTADQQTQLNTAPDGTADSLGSLRLDWLRGDQSCELDNRDDATCGDAAFRNRDTLLADIVHSGPAFVGSQDFNYYLLAESTDNPYVEFLANSIAGRRPMLYVGANDGKVHGFDAIDGTERFAFVPNSVFEKLSQVPATDYVDNHQFLVDESPRHSHAFVGGQWRHVLVGSLGAGGAGVYALDVTDPTALGPSSVLWELDDSDLPELGYTIGSPTVARTRVSTDDDVNSNTPGRWVAVFGNGYNSTNGKAVIYVVSMEDGSVIRSFDTEAGPDNGMSAPLPLDLDGDRITDLIVAGDLQGKLWRIDVRDPDPANWDFLDRRNAGPLPMFDTGGRPITVRPQVTVADGGKHMYLFGTGQYFRVGDNDVGATPPIDSFYGVIAPGTNDSPDGISNTNGVLDRTDLLAQEILEELDAGEWQVRVTSDYEMGNQDVGWYLDLVSPGSDPAGERVISDPVIRGSRVIFTTVIPSDDPCSAGGTSWLMEMDAQSGARLDFSPFDLNDDGEFDEGDYVTVIIDGEEVTVPVSGMRSRVGVIRTPGIIGAGDTEYKYVAGSSGEMERIVERGDISEGRQSWRQMR